MNIAKKPAGGETPRLQNVKRQLHQCCRHVAGVAKRLKSNVDAGGKSLMETELAGDSAELEAAYAVLKTLITTLDPTATVPDLE